MVKMGIFTTGVLPGNARLSLLTVMLCHRLLLTPRFFRIYAVLPGRVLIACSIM